jgi:integrase
LQNWQKFCSERQIHSDSASVLDGLEYLQSLVDLDRGYSAVNTARSALSTVLVIAGVPFGQHSDVKVFMKGVYNLKPPMPRYTSTWDVDVVLRLLKSWAPASKLPMDKLTKKLVVLILLVTGQRPQIFNGLRVDNMDIQPTYYEFVVENKYLKQGRLGFKLDPIRMRKYAPDRRLCVHHYLCLYLERTLTRRGIDKRLVITTKKPYGPASVNTISKWVKLVLQEAGVDAHLGRPGSVRHASTSKAYAKAVPLEDILKAGGWKAQSVFGKYYNKPVHKESVFADQVLS